MLPLTSIEVKRVAVEVTVQKTGKKYTKSKDYAKVVSEVQVPSMKVQNKTYLLLKGRKWTKVSYKEFRKATTKEKENEILKELTAELRQKIEKEMQYGKTSKSR